MALLDFLRPGRRPREGVVLALGGGGARSLAHIGVLAALEEHGIPVAGIAGTSAGSVVGAMWLAHGSAAAVEARWREFLASGVPDGLPDVRLGNEISSRDSLLLHFARVVRRGTAVVLALGRRGLVATEDLERGVAFLLPDIAIEDLRRPFAVVVTDFHSAEPIALRHGSLRAAVTASCAIPGVLPPVIIDGRALVDGGVVADVPVRQARALARRPVVAVDTGDAPAPAEADGIRVPRALMRASQMTHLALRRELLAQADLVLRPDVADVHWSEFTRIEECIEAGREATCKAPARLAALALRRPGDVAPAQAPPPS